MWVYQKFHSEHILGLAMNLKNKLAYLDSLLNNCFVFDQVLGKKLLHFHVDGTYVCKGCFCTTYNISPYLVGKAIDRFVENRKFVHGNLGSSRCSDTTLRTITHAMQLTESLGENYTDGSIHLPCVLNKISFYNLLVETFPDSQIVSKDSFYRLFQVKGELSFIKFPRHTRLGKCDTCTALQLERSRVSDPETKEVYRQRKKEHMDFVLQERLTYTSRCMEACNWPEKFMSLALDKSSPIPFPLVVPFPKSGEASKFKISIFGVISHGTNDRNCVILPSTYSDDPNLAISILWAQIRRLLAASDIRPPVLFLQMDNCAKENKNRFFLAFCSLLIMLRIFKKVTLSFMPPAHGHNNVD